jgi:hypothetical protein
MDIKIYLSDEAISKDISGSINICGVGGVREGCKITDSDSGYSLANKVIGFWSGFISIADFFLAQPSENRPKSITILRLNDMANLKPGNQLVRRADSKEEFILSSRSGLGGISPNLLVYEEKENIIKNEATITIKDILIEDFKFNIDITKINKQEYIIKGLISIETNLFLQSVLFMKKFIGIFLLKEYSKNIISNENSIEPLLNYLYISILSNFKIQVAKNI